MHIFGNEWIQWIARLAIGQTDSHMANLTKWSMKPVGEFGALL